MFKVERSSIQECDEFIINRMREITDKTRVCLTQQDLAIMQAYASLRAAQSLDRLRGE